MLPSLHDNYLISYSVNCENREISLSARRYQPAEDTLIRTVVFTGVQGYHLMNDAFGNIIFSLSEISLDQFFSEYGSEVAESHRLAGAPGAWAADIATGRETLQSEDVKAFILSSSYGLSGWLLATNFEVLEAS
jgi:hypothetical protein